MTPQHKSLLLKLLPLIIGISVILAGIVSYWAYRSSGTVETSENDSMSAEEQAWEEESIALGDWMQEMYDSEDAPEIPNSVPDGVDPMNYGLDGGIPNTPVSGLYILSGKQPPFDYDLRFFSIDVSSSTAQAVVYNEDYDLSGIAEFNNPNNPSGYFFVNQISDAPGGEGIGISYFDTDSSEVIAYETTLGDVARNIEWTQETELLAYNRLKKNLSLDYASVTQIDINNHEVVVLKPKTEEIVSIIPNALQPKWLPDGEQLIVMKDDGLYSYTIESEQENILWKVAEGGVVPAISMFDLSPDGKYLAWTTAGKGTITMFEVVSDKEEGVGLNELGRISLPDTEVFWPQFSPSGEYYSVQAIDTLKEGDYVRKNARIEIRPTNGREIVYNYSLDNFAFNALFADDWIVDSQ